MRFRTAHTPPRALPMPAGALFVTARAPPPRRLHIARCHDRGLRRGAGPAAADDSLCGRRRARQALLLHLCRRAAAAAAAAREAARHNPGHPAVSAPPRRPQVQWTVHAMPEGLCGVVEVCCLWQQAVTAQQGNSLPVCADIVPEQSSVRVLSMVLPRLLADSLRLSLLQGRELPRWHGDARAYKQQLRLRRAWHGAVLKQRCRRSCTDCRMCLLPRGPCRWRMLQDPGSRQTRVQLWKYWPFCGCSLKVLDCVGS